jgi:hypothetical protein
MTTIKLTNGVLGGDVLLVRADLTQASAPIQVNANYQGWVSTCYQTADAEHRDEGLVAIGQRYANDAMGVPEDLIDFDEELRDDAMRCDWEIVSETMTWEFSGAANQKAMTIAEIAANQMTSLGEDSLTDDVVEAVIEHLGEQDGDSWDARSVRAVLADCAFMPAV